MFSTMKKTLEIPLRLENGDYSPSSLMKVRDCKQVSLFDEVQVNTRIHSCLKIDVWGIVSYLFFTFYRKCRLEGSF